MDPPMIHPQNKPRLLVLISGSGTNLQALIDATANDSLNAQITHVISNKKAAYGLSRASSAGIPTSYHNLLSYKKKKKKSYPESTTDPTAAAAAAAAAAREAYDADLAQLIISHSPDLVVCAGWMHILSPAALEPLAAAGIDIINLHPALPGEFDGADAIGRAWEGFKSGAVKRTGVMIHWVIAAVDRGEPIVVREVEIREGESREELEVRMHEVEHVEIVNGARIALDIRRERGKGL